MSDRLNKDANFDVLGDVLETLRFRGTIFFRSDLAAPWGIALAPANMPRFHIALAGDCFVGAEGCEDVNVQHMGIVMFPNGHSHWIADQPGRELVPSERAAEACELGDPVFQRGKITHRLMCGLVHFDSEAAHPILDALPHIMHFPELKETEPVWMTVTLIDAQMRSTQNRVDRIVDRLTEVLFLQLLNRYVGENNDTTGFIAALHDRRIHRALTLIHRQPDLDWSLSSLSEKIGMSRATLVRHFKDAIGVAPMTYIMNWRIMKAYNLVKYTEEPLERIAASVGLATARTLSKAFQRQYGYTPTELRRSRSES